MAPSGVWILCPRSKDKKSAQCSKCGKVFQNPATSTLRYHLKNVHLINVPKVEQPSRRSASTSATIASEDEDDPMETAREQDRSAEPRSDSAPTSTPHRDGDDAASQPQRRIPAEVTIDKAFANQQSFSAGGFREQRATNALLFMLVHDDMPLCSPDKIGLRTLIKAVQPHYDMPVAKTTTKKLEEKYHELKAWYSAKMAKAEGICLTVDLWTDSSMHSFLGMTAHFREGTRMESVEIGVRFMEERKDTENLSAVLREMCSEWKIDISRVTAVVTDGGNNIKAAVRVVFGGEKHLSCAAHLINCVGQTALGLYVSKRPSEVESPDEVVGLVPDDERDAEAILEDVEDDLAGGDNLNAVTVTCLQSLIMKVKRIVRFFRTSEVASVELKQAQIRNGKEEDKTLKLIQEVRTRWNSSYYMIERFLVLANEVTAVLITLQRERGSTKKKPPAILSGNELEVLTEVRDLLRPLEEVTRGLCKEKEVTLSSVIPMIYGLKKDISQFLPTHGVVLNLQQKLLREIEVRFSGIELLKPYAAATLLDPRYKNLVFENDVALALIIRKISKTVAEKSRLAPAPAEGMPETSTTHEVPGGVWAAVDQKIREKTDASWQREVADSNAMPKQLQMYLNLPVVDRRINPNPLSTWLTMKTGMEAVFDLAMEYLPLVATSVPSERLFSHAGLVMTQRRNRLSPKNLNMLVFLRAVPKSVWFK